MNALEYSIVFRIDANYLNEKGDKLCSTLKDWIEFKGYDALVYTFVLDDDLGDLIVDYNEDKKHGLEIKKYIIQVLEKFNIKYEIEE